MTQEISILVYDKEKGKYSEAFRQKYKNIDCRIATDKNTLIFLD